MRAACPLLLLPALLGACRGGGETRVNLLHFSDYHSHARPFFGAGRGDRGGIARVVAYARTFKERHPAALVLSGGDTLNAGVPAWSDRYRCAEWPWWNGLLDAMALGNHDLDYGWQALGDCRRQAAYPLLSANLLVDGKGALWADGKPYLIKEVGGVRVGLFALAGPDFPRLVPKKDLPPEARFADPTTTAARIVDALRTDERVNAVVFLGHQDREADFAMARQVPGIDVILGSHSHYKGEFQRIPGTSTWFVSPYQYLGYLSEVELVLRGGKLAAVAGRLVPVGPELPADPRIAARVEEMERELERDPRYRRRFLKIGSAAAPIGDQDIDRGESPIGNFVMDRVRAAASAHAAFSTASSFRAGLPPGDLRLEDLLSVLPYKNRVLLFEMSGAELQGLLDYGAAHRGSDSFAVTSGLRYTLAGGQAKEVSVLVEGDRYAPLDPARSYRVAATDYIAAVAAGYKDRFAKARGRRDTGLVLSDPECDPLADDLPDPVLAHVRRHSPVSARLEGRVTVR